MKVMVIGKANKNTEAGRMPPREMWEQMAQFNEDLVKAGILLVGEGLKPSSTGVRVRCSGKDHIVTDGPFAETKELVAGYMIWQVKSMEEAIAWVKRSPMTDDSEVEIRPIFSYSPEEVSEIVSQAK
jgi:AraC family transcriptional regulator